MPGERHPNELHSVEINREMDSQIAERALALREEGVEPTLAILSDHPEHAPSQMYIGIKERVARRLHIVPRVVFLASGQPLADEIERIGEQSGVHAMIVQLPSSQLRGDELHEALLRIPPEKDVDGLRGDPEGLFPPATPSSVRRLMDGNGVDYRNKDRPFVIRGVGKLVGGPLFQGLDDEGHPNLHALDIHTPPKLSRRLLNEAGVIVTATGSPRSLTPEVFDDFSERKVIIDAGTAEHDGEVVGDVSPELRAEALGNGWQVSAEKGSVGPLTVRMLLEHTVIAAEKQAGIAA